MDKNIMHHIHYDRQLPIDFNDHIIKITGTLTSTYAEQVDEYVLKQLYDYYLDSDITDLFVINIQQFKEFLLKYLPIYLSEVNKNESKSN